MDSFVNSFKKSAWTWEEQNMFDDFVNFDATEEFSLPKFNIPTCYSVRTLKIFFYKYTY